MASGSTDESIVLPKWTNRGTASCPKCGHKYMTARKPKLCEGCHFEIGGSYVPKPKLNIPDCVIVYIEGDTSLYSVNSSTRDDRCLVLVQGTNCLCYHETCKQQRAIHLSSSSERPFSCKHSEKIDRKPQEPLEKYFLSDESIRTYPADIGTQETILSLMERSSASQAVAMKVSDKNFVVYGKASTSTPICYTHVQFNKGNYICSSKDCKSRGGNTKQLKSKKICLHVHVLLCVLREHVKPTVDPTPTSPEEIAEPRNSSVCRQRTVELMARCSLPYPVPNEVIIKCRNIDAWSTAGIEDKSWPSSFIPSQESCELCGTQLSLPKTKPGSDGKAFLMTHQHMFHVVQVLVKFCENPECQAMHRVWPLSDGLFNINDKVLLALEVLVEWRELFKRGVPVKVFVESTIRSWCATTCPSDVIPSSGQQRYLVELLYNGFYCFEAITERSLDDVICGVCGVAGEVYCGDGNQKNCCDLSCVNFNNSCSNSECEPVSLEDFLVRLKKYWVEKTTYTKTELDDGKVDAATVPPIIAPSARAEKVYNTEMQKRSVYLKPRKEINGDPAVLHALIKSKNLDMNDMDSWNTDSLRALCQACDINVAGMSNGLMIAELRSLYATLLVGTSPCHEFTKVSGHTGGFYHFVCRHGTTVGSKFLMLQESVRDAADIYLSLKYPPTLFVNDTPCTFSRHLDIRAPNVTKYLWGDNVGCFEPPSLDKCPSQVSVPHLVPLEFQSSRMEYKDEQELQEWEHPVTGHRHRYVVGDRFHSSTNPHKSPLCRFHDLDLCEQKNAIKTSYQESENNRKIFLRLRSSTMQKFLVHFHYNYLMDYYHNEKIVEDLTTKMLSRVREDEKLVRGPYHKLVVKKK